MRKPLVVFAAVLLLSAPAFATYYVVMKDGSRYLAKSKWTVINGKAIVHLENGSTIWIDPSTIDAEKSEETTRMGGASVLAVEQTPTNSKPKQSSLGAAIRLRKLPGQPQPAVTSTAPAQARPTTGPLLGSEVLEKFERAYENVGIFEHKVVATGAHSLRADLTADNEEKVFNAISATSFLIMRNAGVTGAQVDMVELFMKTTTGGSSGRFQMTRADAQMLDSKQVSREDYFIRKVIY
jgi:hypothetical protein